MSLNSNLKFYCEQGLISSPGSYHTLFDKFSTDIPELCVNIHKFMLIDLLANMGLLTVPKKHLNDVSIRGIEDKLKEVVDRDNSDILNSRSNEKLLLGNCRDLSLMICSSLRSHKIPARVRSGFATFFDPFQKKKFDHWVCEYWNKIEERWIKVDPWMSQIQYKKGLLAGEIFEGLIKLDYRPYNVKDKYFLTGGEAWLNCRENGHNPDNYGTYEELLKGLWFVRDNMIRDLLCLIKVEPLPWDCWGIMGRENNNITNNELSQLDDIAKLLVEENFSKENLLQKLSNLHIEKSIITKKDMLI